MKSKFKYKGFTLIELLAVFIILAIIALIAVPTILGIIDKAREGAAEDATYGLISAAETYYAEHFMENAGDEPSSITWNDVKPKVKGTLPSDKVAEGEELTFIVIDGKIGVRNAKFYGKYVCSNVIGSSGSEKIGDKVTCSE